jgi:roadblock/LC7 domain-containing protein
VTLPLPRHSTLEWLARLTAVFLGLATGLGTAAACAQASTHSGLRGLRRLAANPQLHVDTWAYDDGCNGGAGARPRFVRTWVTFAENNCGPGATKAQTDCRANGTLYCYVMQYLDTNWDFTDDPIPVANAASGDMWLHAPSTQPFTDIYSSGAGGGRLMNQSSPAVRAFFQSYVRTYYNEDDGLLMDWQSPSLSQELSYATCGCSSTIELPTNQMLRAAHREMAAAMTHRDGAPFVQADNSLPLNPYLPQGINMLDPAMGVDGWVAEGAPEDDGKLDRYYSTLLDQMAYITTRTTGFVTLLSYGDARAGSQQWARRVQEATVLLGFKPARVVDWADLERGSPGLAVWPEEGIYPTDPAESMRAPGGPGCLAGVGVVCSQGGHNNLEVAPGVYRRVFRACYNRRMFFGACAAIVNTTGHPVVVRASWLSGVALAHRIALVGGDVQSEGTIQIKGSPFHAGRTAVGPHDAMLLSQ